MVGHIRLRPRNGCESLFASPGRPCTSRPALREPWLASGTIVVGSLLLIPKDLFKPVSSVSLFWTFGSLRDSRFRRLENNRLGNGPRYRASTFIRLHATRLLTEPSACVNSFPCHEVRLVAKPFDRFDSNCRCRPSAALAGNGSRLSHWLGEA